MSFVDHLASGPRSVEIGRTPTVASRKCVATVRKKSIPSSFSSSSTVNFRGLEGSDTKAENWSATESRQIEEDDRELNHPVSENKGPLDVPIVSVPTRSDHSGPIDCEERCPRSPAEIISCPLLHTETSVHRRGTTTTPVSCTVCSISRAIQGPSSSATDQHALGSMWPKFFTLPTSRGHKDLERGGSVE